ncbi:MAG: hypothetical protein ACK4Z5_04965 [Brevundimonas sp.]
MSVKISLSPREAAALFLAAEVGANSMSLTTRQRNNASNALERVRRRLVVHKVDLAWADDEVPFQRRRKEAAR